MIVLTVPPPGPGMGGPTHFAAAGFPLVLTVAEPQAALPTISAISNMRVSFGMSRLIA